jgi:hypothetical protein
MEILFIVPVFKFRFYCNTARKKYCGLWFSLYVLGKVVQRHKKYSYLNFLLKSQV